MKKVQFNFAYLGFTLFAVFAVQVWIAWKTVTTLDYSEFLTHLEGGRVAAVTVTESRIEGTFREPVEGKTLFVTNGLSDDMTLVDTASAKAIKTVAVGRVPHSIVIKP